MSNKTTYVTVSETTVLQCGVFFIFLILKLTNYINWSWWYVTAPLYAPYILTILTALVIIAYLYIKEIIQKYRK